MRAQRVVSYHLKYHDLTKHYSVSTDKFLANREIQFNILTKYSPRIDIFKNLNNLASLNMLGILFFQTWYVY